MRTCPDRRRTALPVLLIALACGLSNGPPGRGGGLVPQPKPPGLPLELPTKVTVTAAGATVSTRDGALTIAIPAGAVTAPTDVTITRITNTAVGAIASAFRLGPEGTTFGAAVTLTFRGPVSYPTSGGIGDVGVSYQDANGNWVSVGPASRDRNANTISVGTDHFSDWTLTWQTGTPVAEGPIRLSQTYGVPFVADGRATLYLQSGDASGTAYVLAGTLTAPSSIALGNDVCVPDQVTKSWVNTAEVDGSRGVFRWGIGVSWTLTCTSPGGAVTIRDMPAVFDTMGINLTRCLGTYDPGQFAEPAFLKGAYTTDCGTEGAVRATWELRGYQVLVDPTSGLVTAEAGGTATFQLTLSNAPSADVSVAVSSSSPEGSASPATVTFTPADWSTPHVVTVTGVDDFVDDGEVVYAIRTAPAASADVRYAGIDAPDVEVTSLDDDVPGLATAPDSGLVTTEAGGTATFQVSLSSQPLADVVIAVSTGDATEGAVAPATLTFTAATWSVAQAVTVTGVDDLIADGPVGFTIHLASASADAGYAGRTGTASVTNGDDDVAAIGVSAPSGTTTSEAATQVTFTVVLGSQPTADVTIPLSSSDGTEATVSPSSLVFTAATWNVPQSVTVTGVDDLVADGPQPYTIFVGNAQSADAGYAGRDPADLAFTNADDDLAAVVVGAPSGIATTEAGAAVTFTLALASQPTADVTIPLSSSDSAEGAVAPASVTFSAADWDVPQTVTVTGVDDLVDDGDRVYDVVIGAADTADPAYAARDPADLVVLNVDDDTAAIIAVPSAGITTTEAGGTATFEVTLATEPIADVTLAVASGDPAEGTAAPASLTFSPTDWNVPQRVTVTGVDDLLVDGDVPYTVQLSASSPDAAYAGAAAAVTVTNLDDDGPPPGLAAGGSPGAGG
jgi:hypothetical protein